MGFDTTVRRILEPTDDGKMRESCRYTVKNADAGLSEVFQTVGDPISGASAA